MDLPKLSLGQETERISCKFERIWNQIPQDKEAIYNAVHYINVSLNTMMMYSSDSPTDLIDTKAQLADALLARIDTFISLSPIKDKTLAYNEIDRMARKLRSIGWPCFEKPIREYISQALQHKKNFAEFKKRMAGTDEKKGKNK